MSDRAGTTSYWDTLLDNFAAQLTRAAYSHVLQQGMRGPWLEVELRLWKAVWETVRIWVSEWPTGGSSDDLKVWQEGLLVDLTEAAFYLALDCGIDGPLPEVELGLEQAFRSVITRIGQESLSFQVTGVRCA